MHAVCADLALQLLADAEGASKEIAIEVVGAASEDDAVDGRPARSPAATCFKCAIHGEDPNWGRVLSAVGTTDAAFEPDRLDVAINGVWVCRRRRGRRGPRPGRPRPAARSRSPSTSPPARATATIWTNDLTAAYVHENSAYST